MNKIVTSITFKAQKGQGIMINKVKIDSEF